MRDGHVGGHVHGALRYALVGVAVFALSAGSVVAQSTTAMAASAAPGVPQDPQVVFTENFENGQGAAPIVVTDYTGPAPVDQTYKADPAWLTACNGWVASQQNPANPPAGSGCGGWWSSVKQLAGTLGKWAGGDPATNHAVTAYTNADPGPNKTQLEAVTPVAIGAPNRFLTFSVDAAEVNCYANHAKMGFYLLDGQQAVPTFTTPIEPCANPGTTVGGIAVGTYTSNSPVLFGGSAVGLRLVNFQASGYGNDAAFDNVRILDVTPQLDAAYSPASVEVGTDATLTFTITNTSELAVKNGWSFTERLPTGLTVAAAAPATDCAAPQVTAPAGSGQIGVTGTLPAGQASCTVKVAVTAARAGTYTTCAADLAGYAGVNPPGCAAVRFVPPVLAFDAHAHGGRVSTRLLTVGPLEPSDITCTETPGADRHALVKATLPGLGSLRAIRTEASGSVDPAGLRTAAATARTAHLRLLGGLVTAKEIVSTAKAQGDDAGHVNSTGQVTLTDLKVNGVAITDTKANLTIDIPLVAKVVINEQVTSADGIAVNAIHIRTPAGADIVIGHARAALTVPGKPCPTY
ncbi:choice-of-anchor P family protein [Nonomuraea muscovyensis]|uniref:choice-of-anchor P family protein n=1 Tax=Nonomuraea muscovyensis TaxID=1124761 RepID=UPI0033CE0A53